MALTITVGCGQQADARDEAARLAGKRVGLADIQARLAQKPKDAVALYDLGSTLWFLGEITAAEAALRQSMALDANLEVVIELVGLLDTRGHYLEASRWIDRIQAGRTPWPTWLTELDEQYLLT